MQHADERASHGLGGAEPAAAGDDVDGVVGLLEAASGGFETRRLDEPRRRGAGLLTEAAGEVARAHRCVHRERLDRQVGVEMLGDEVLHVAQGVTISGLQRQLGAELRLVAGTAEEQHEAARDRQRHVSTDVFLDECERQVHASGDAGRGPHVAVAHVDRIGVHLDGRVAPGEGVADGPVRRRTPTIEQAGFGQHERAAAHAGHVPAPLRGPTQPCEQSSVGHRSGRPIAADDHEDVDAASHGCEVAVGHDRDARRRAHRRSVGGDDPNRPPGEREDLGGTGEVQALEALEGDDHDHARQHGGRPSWLQ